MMDGDHVGHMTTHVTPYGYGNQVHPDEHHSDVSAEQRQRAFVGAIAGSETDFNRQEAYSEKYNQPSNNKNVKELGQAGADYGYFQMNQKDIDEAVRLGVPPEIAKNLAGGGAHGNVPIEDQSRAVMEYMKKRWPNEFEKFGQTGDFEAMRKTAAGKWFGLSRAGGVPAREQYDRILKAIQDEQSK